MGLLAMDDGIVNWGEHTEVEETNHALMAISSSSEVSLCSKTCIDSYNKLKILCDEQMNQLGDQEAHILAYSQAVKKLEAQLVTFQKQQLSLNEKLTFQANEIYEKDEKLKRYRRIGMKAVKEKEQLQKTLDSWKDSSKNLWRLLIKGMSSIVIRSIGTSSEHSVDHESDISSVPPEVYMSTPKTTNEKGVSDPKSKEEELNANMERGELGEGYSFIKKKCFVCGSLSHLIRDCDFYEKKMAREAELKKQRVFNTGNGVAKPVWNNANRVNHANHFVPRPVQLIAVRQNVNSVRPNVNTGRANVNSVRQNVNSVRSNVNTGSFNINTVKAKQPIHTSNSNSFSPVRPQVNKFNQRSHFSKSHSPVRRPIVRNTAKMSYTHAVKGNWGTAIKTSAGYNWRKTRPNSNCNSGSNFIRTDHPLKNMEDRGIFDSGCSGHMTGNKDHLDDFEECKGGSVTFGGSKGYITGKGRIRHKVLFTKTECLVVSPDFKMPDENQILLKVPRQHNMYSFDMKTPAPAKDYTCLIAKATSDESKLWHRRSDNGTEFNNRDMLEFCGNKGIKQEYSNARTPQQNGVAERMNMTLIKAARTMLADSLLPTTFWAEAMFDIDYLTDSMNYIPVSLENQTNPHAGTSEVTNSAGTLQTPNANASEEEDKAEELIVVPIAVRHTASKVRPRKSSTNSKAEEFLTELQNLKTQENEAYSTADMPELTIFNKPQKGIFDEASYDDEGMVHDFNNLPTEVAVSLFLLLGYTTFTHKVKYWVIPKVYLYKLEAECSKIQEHMHLLKKSTESLKSDQFVDIRQVAVHFNLGGMNKYKLADRKYPLTKRFLPSEAENEGFWNEKMKEFVYNLLKMNEKQAGVKRLHEVISSCGHMLETVD
ncbi:ribonuclease H-like domain-containing protein [Tanacetum coccineum]